ncbi:hypothetical protein ACIQZM_09730 [Peribacillus sp. NPDC097206]|uniref:hypothetical protein n=1 Tax=unclassified Peribacillus TaxID=2675266 RepID=UPI0037FA210A
MNFTNKAQSINNYLDNYYKKLLKDGSAVRDYQTLVKQFNLETTKLFNYKFAIKEEIENELVQSPDFKSLDDAAKQHTLFMLDKIHQDLRIPEFRVAKQDCLEIVTVSTETNIAATPKKQSQAIVNIGTAIGAVVGLGVGLIIEKSFPVLFIGGFGGAAIGSFLGKGAGSNGIPNQQAVPVSTEPKQMFEKMSPAKLETVIQARKTTIKSLFSQYCKQLEAAVRQV